ncbi:MAG: alkaline phosphatase [Bacteroidales bacterium]|nr:alkaline phosphatase [Bacteroidales bacterium]
MRKFSFTLLVTASMLFITSIQADAQGKKSRNIILFVGDGMGVTQWYAGIAVKKGQMNIEKFPVTGFSKTYSTSHFSADGASAGTAMASGVKTYNGAVGLNTDTLPVKTILEYAREKGIVTGVVTANTLMEGSIAPFVAHEKSRMLTENIAASYVENEIDVFIGGGSKFFTQRKDQRNLVDELKQKGYQVAFSIDEIRNIRQGKLAGFTSAENNPSLSEGRGTMFPDAVETAINILSRIKKGFILIVENSFPDRASHLENGELVALETIDLDNAVGKAYDFAMKNGNTVVIVTAGQEASGMSIAEGSITDGTIKPKWAEHGMIHTGVMVPVFAFGPGSDVFSGIQENTDIFLKMMALLRLKAE